MRRRISAGYCVDIHAKEAVAADETTLRLNLVAAWRHPREALAGPGGPILGSFDVLALPAHSRDR